MVARATYAKMFVPAAGHAGFLHVMAHRASHACIESSAYLANRSGVSAPNAEAAALDGEGASACALGPSWPPSYIVFDCRVVLGNLVVSNNNGGDHLSAISTLSTPFNAPLAPWSRAAHIVDVLGDAYGCF